MKGKKGIEKHQIQGEHFFMQSGWNGDFGDFLNLDWIPRYMVIGAEGEIKLFKAVKANDKRIKQILNYIFTIHSENENTVVCISTIALQDTN